MADTTATEPSASCNIWTALIVYEHCDSDEQLYWVQLCFIWTLWLAAHCYHNTRQDQVISRNRFLPTSSWLSLWCTWLTTKFTNLHSNLIHAQSNGQQLSCTQQCCTLQYCRHTSTVSCTTQRSAQRCHSHSTVLYSAVLLSHKHR